MLQAINFLKPGSPGVIGQDASVIISDGFNDVKNNDEGKNGCFSGQLSVVKYFAPNQP